MTYKKSTALPSLPKTKEEINESLPDIIKRIEPSIVVIFTYSGKFDVYLKEKEKEDILRLGSGFFISHNGEIITNYHVLEGAGSQIISVDDYIKDKFPSIFSFYLSSIEDLDSYEKEFIDLLQKLPEAEQEYYAKEVYKNGFSIEILEDIKDGKIIQVPASNTALL